jgi:hypothetical protein
MQERKDYDILEGGGSKVGVINKSVTIKIKISDIWKRIKRCSKSLKKL